MLADVLVTAVGVAVTVAAVGGAVGGTAADAVEAAAGGTAEAAVGAAAAVVLVTIGTDCNTADCTTDWMTKGLALSCLGGGLDRLTMMSDMACWAWDR